jgi:hypothetical protein
MPVFNIVPISVVFVAFLHASLILFYGWSARPQIIETEAEMALRQRKELAKAQHNAKMRAVQAGGLGAALRAARQSATGKQDETLSPVTQAEYGGDGDAPTGDNVVTFPGPKRAAKKTGLQWTASDLQAYIRATYAQELDDATAAFRIRVLGKEKRLDGVPGRPYYANNKASKAWADATYKDQAIAD